MDAEGPLIVLLDVRRDYRTGWEGLLLGSSARVERRIRNPGLSVRSRWLTKFPSKYSKYWEYPVIEGLNRSGKSDIFCLIASLHQKLDRSTIFLGSVLKARTRSKKRRKRGY